MQKYESRGKIEHAVISPFYSKLSRVPSVQGDVFSTSVEFVEYGVVDNVKSTEFSLGNLIAIGADKSLTYVSMSLNSDMNFVDRFAESYNELTNVQENQGA